MRIPQTHLVFPQESWRDAMCASHIPRLHRPATRRPTCPAVKQRAGVGAQLWEGGGETTGWGQGSFGMTGEENVLILSSEWDERWGLFSAPLPPLSNSHLHQSHIWEEEVGSAKLPQIVWEVWWREGGEGETQSMSHGIKTKRSSLEVIVALY